jgi:hypothetical protein
VAANEKALIAAAVKWMKKRVEGWGNAEVDCKCVNCNLIRAVRRVVKERRKP